MNRFKNYVWMAVGFGVLVAVVSGITAGPMIAALVKAAIVKNVDERGRTPYQVNFTCSGVSGCSHGGGVVDSNKRLVIEHVNAIISVGSGKPITQSVLANTGFADTEYLPYHLESSSAGGDDYYVNEQVLLYVNAGEAPSISVFTSAGDAISMTATITGYLVDLTL